MQNMCGECGKVTSNKKFCSRKCAATYNNRVAPKRTPKRRCPRCSRSSRSTDNFCSKECRRLDFLDKWVSGTISNPSSHVAKAALRVMYDNKCQECSWSQTSKWTQDVPLTLEHIDGDPANNSFNNLKLLCPNCHSLTENFCGRNTASSRKKRGLGPVPKESLRRRFRYT